MSLAGLRLLGEGWVEGESWVWDKLESGGWREVAIVWADWEVTPTGHADVWIAGASLTERAVSSLGLHDHLGDLTKMRKTAGRRVGKVVGRREQ